MTTISVNVKGQPKGTPMGIKGLAVVPNGGSVEIDESALQIFENDKGMSVQEVFKNSKAITVSGKAKKTDEGGDS